MECIWRTNFIKPNQEETVYEVWDVPKGEGVLLEFRSGDKTSKVTASLSQKFGYWRLKGKLTGVGIQKLGIRGGLQSYGDVKQVERHHKGWVYEIEVEVPAQNLLSLLSKSWHSFTLPELDLLPDEAGVLRLPMKYIKKFNKKAQREYEVFLIKIITKGGDVDG